MRRLIAFVAVALVAGLLAVGLREASRQNAGAGDASSFDLAAAREELAGAPAPLADLHERANELLDGGPPAFRRQLAALEGHPVVINKWASWCGPCRAEAPILQRQAVEHGKRVAFLGVDWRDSSENARDFLGRHPLPFPSYEDRDGRIGEVLKLPDNIPATIFLDARGEVAYLHQGAYRSDADLAADIERYVPGP